MIDIPQANHITLHTTLVISWYLMIGRKKKRNWKVTCELMLKHSCVDQWTVEKSLTVSTTLIDQSNVTSPRVQWSLGYSRLFSRLPGQTVTSMKVIIDDHIRSGNMEIVCHIAEFNWWFFFFIWKNNCLNTYSIEKLTVDITDNFAGFTSGL